MQTEQLNALDRGSRDQVISVVGGQSSRATLSTKRRNHYVSPNLDWPLIAGGIALFVVVLVEPRRLVRLRTSACSRAGTDADCP